MIPRSPVRKKPSGENDRGVSAGMRAYPCITFGPRTAISPTASGPCSAPVTKSTAFSSTPGSGRPTVVRRFSSESVKRVTVTVGAGGGGGGPHAGGGGAPPPLRPPPPPGGGGGGRAGGAAAPRRGGPPP